MGKKSPVPNINGFGKASVDYLKELGVPERLWGFGHLNAFPAQLVVLDVADPLIVQKK